MLWETLGVESQLTEAMEPMFSPVSFTSRSRALCKDCNRALVQDLGARLPALPLGRLRADSQGGHEDAADAYQVSIFIRVVALLAFVVVSCNAAASCRPSCLSLELIVVALGWGC
jgi:hypothetical protein